MNLDIGQMTRQQKLQAMHDLWEDLVKDDEAVESPAWHADALKETAARVQAGTELVWDWEAAKRELKNRAR
jgi:hypothetical protein